MTTTAFFHCPFAAQKAADQANGYIVPVRKHGVTMFRVEKVQIVEPDAIIIETMTAFG